VFVVAILNGKRSERHHNQILSLYARSETRINSYKEDGNSGHVAVYK
jgi:hypothetical protein